MKNRTSILIAISVFLFIFIYIIYSLIKDLPCNCTREPDNDRFIELRFKITSIPPECQGRYQWVKGTNDRFEQSICYANKIYNMPDNNATELKPDFAIPLIKIAEVGDSIIKLSGTLNYELVKKDTSFYFYLFRSPTYVRVY